MTSAESTVKQKIRLRFAKDVLFVSRICLLCSPGPQYWFPLVIILKFPKEYRDHLLSRSYHVFHLGKLVFVLNHCRANRFILLQREGEFAKCVLQFLSTECERPLHSFRGAFVLSLFYEPTLIFRNDFPERTFQTETRQVVYLCVRLDKSKGE